jgi:hypothetical protein
LPKHFLYSLLRYDSLRRGPTHKSMRKQLRRTHASVDRDRNCSLCWRSWNSLCCPSLSRPRLPSYIPASVGPWSLPLCLFLSLSLSINGLKDRGGMGDEWRVFYCQQVVGYSICFHFSYLLISKDFMCMPMSGDLFWYCKANVKVLFCWSIHLTSLGHWCKNSSIIIRLA